jgi:predicted PurR-regulated permease PerM
MSPAVPPIRLNMSSAILLAGVVIGLYLCYRLAIPFLSPLVWAFTLAVLFRPFCKRLGATWGSEAASASATVVVIAIVVVIPAIFVLSAMLAEAVRGAGLLSSAVDSGAWRNVIETHPWLAPAAKWMDERLNIPDLVDTATSWLTTWSASLLRGSFAGFVNLLLTFYFLFYLLRDGHHAKTTVQHLLPLTAPEFSKLSERVENTIRATVYGTVIVAALQGALGGLMFWWLEIPAPLFWGVVMGLLAIVPFLGAFVIWAPVAVYLALAGQWGSAILLTLWGTAVIGLIDNVLYPVLVGSRLMMHTVPSFIAVVGGVILFGTHGLILGPLVITVSIVLLHIWRERADVVGNHQTIAKLETPNT